MTLQVVRQYLETLASVGDSRAVNILYLMLNSASGIADFSVQLRKYIKTFRLEDTYTDQYKDTFSLVDMFITGA